MKNKRISEENDGFGQTAFRDTPAFRECVKDLVRDENGCYRVSGTAQLVEVLRKLQAEKARQAEEDGRKQQK